MEDFLVLGLVIISAVLLSFMALVLRSYFAKRKAQKIAIIFSAVPEFNPTIICESDKNFIIGIDSENKKIVLLNKTSKEVSIILNENLFSIKPEINFINKSEGRHLVGAAIGGIAGGAMGGIIGGTLGSIIRKNLDLVVKKITIKIEAKSLSMEGKSQESEFNLKLYEVSEEGISTTYNLYENSYIVSWQVLDSLTLFPNMIDEETKEIMKYQKIKGNLIAVHNWIKEQKGNFIKSLYKSDIIEVLSLHCTNKHDSLIFLKMYSQMYSTDILDELKSNASSDSIIREYLSPFIRFEIVLDRPHIGIHHRWNNIRYFF